MLRRMRVPLLDLRAQYQTIADSVRTRVDDVLASQRFVLGPQLDEFEREIGAFLGTPRAIGVSSGTDAILAGLMALGIGPGDAVITTAYSFFAVAASVVRLGAMPIFVDVDLATYNLSVDALEQEINKCKRDSTGALFDSRGNRIRAIIPVHLFGLCCEIGAIQQVATRHGLRVIEDAAQAIGAEVRENSAIKKAGTIGEVGCFSFYPSKNLGAGGDAGLIVCSDDELAKQLRIIRHQGMEPRYHHHVIGGNFRLDEIQAAILNAKLPRLKEWTGGRRAAAGFYDEEFKQKKLTDRITLPVDPHRASGLMTHVYHQYVIRTPNRDALREHLAKREIGTEIYYPIGLHLQKCFANLGYKAGDLPQTERAARESLALPMYPELSREAQQYVVGVIAEFLG